jgi:hypothetical protein
MRARIWIFTAVVTLALALNLARVSLSIAQTGEDTMRARVAAASTALRGQLDLLDARLAPRAVAMMPDLIEVVRGGEGQPPTRPDERALRAAGSVLAPEPDLFAVASPHGAVVSRRARPVQMIDDSTQLPLAQTASGAMLAPTFAPFDGAVYRFAAARVPGAAAAAVVGTVVDDRFAAQLKSQVDADVTLLQGGRIVASSLPQGEERTRLTRWTTAPGPGYGVLQIRLPFVGTALSGMLPLPGATHYAVRGALIPLDGGVQAALTVPASPYLAWLGRYQAFYLVGLAVLVLFAFVWGLFARAPAPVIQPVSAPPELFEPEDGVVSPPRRAPRMPSLVGTDEQQSSPPKKSRDASWPPGERPSGERRFVGNVSAVTAIPAGERLDPDLSPAAAPQHAPPSVAGGEAEAASDSAVWGADAPAPGPFTSPAPTSSEAVPDWDMPAPPAPASASAEGEQKRDFGFGDPLDPPVPPPAEASDPAAGDGNAQPPAEEPAAEPFPGDEPTRSEGVSAALMDKLRERDEEVRAQADGAPQSSDTLQDFMPPAQDSDPDESHWRETYDRFCELKEQLGESADGISFERFAAKLKKNRAELVAKHNCKGVRFSVYEKDGKAAIKAAAIR